MAVTRATRKRTVKEKTVVQAPVIEPPVIEPGCESVSESNINVPPLVSKETPQTIPEIAGLTWNRKEVNRKGKVALTSCIIIDNNQKWHEGVKLDLSGRNTHDYTWGYYGKRYPVLVETKNHELMPYVPSDLAGESPQLLYIASKSSGYKSYMRMESDMLRKMMLGAMVILAVVIMFLIYVMIS